MNFYSCIEQKHRAIKRNKEQNFNSPKITKWNTIENLELLGHPICTSFASFPSSELTSVASQELKCCSSTSCTSERKLPDYIKQEENTDPPKYRIGPSRTEIDFSKHWKHQDPLKTGYKTPDTSFQRLEISHTCTSISNQVLTSGKINYNKNLVDSIHTGYLPDGRKEDFPSSEVEIESLSLGKNDSDNNETTDINKVDKAGNNEVEKTSSVLVTNEEPNTLMNLCCNIEKIKSAFRTNEKKMAYENMEHDIKDMIDDLLIQSAQIKDTVVGTGVQEEDIPPVLFSFYTDDHFRNIEDVHWLMDTILDNVFETCNSGTFSNNDNVGDANNQSGQEKNKNSKIANDLNELGAIQPCKEPVYTKTQTYFCTATLNKIPKTSWTFGESQLPKTKKNFNDKSEDILIQSLDKCSDMFKFIFQETSEGPHNSCNKYVGGKSVEQLKSVNFDELSNFEKRFSNSDQVVCVLKSSKKESNNAFKTLPQMQRSTKNFHITKQLKETVRVTEQLSSPVESLEEVLHSEYFSTEEAACATSDSILSKQNHLPKKCSIKSYGSYASSSSSEEIIRQRPVRKRKFSLENINKLLKPAKAKNIREVSKVDVTTSAENSPNVGPTDTDYEGEREESNIDFARPKIKHRHKSELELNTPSEIRMIEINVMQNDRLERQGCLVLGKPVCNFDSDSSFNHSNCSDITLRRQSL